MSATAEFDPNAYLAEKHAAEIATANGDDFDPRAYLNGGNVPQSSTQNTIVPQTQEIPRPDATTGPTRGMDPFAYQGALMASPQGQQAVAQFGQTVKNMGLEGGGAAGGQILGAFGGPADMVTVPLGGAIGGGLGNIAAQLTTPGKPFSFGDVGAAMTAGLVPGASLAKAGAGQVIKQGAKYALGNVAAQNFKSIIDNKQLASPTEDLVAAGAGAIAAPLSKYLDTGSRPASAAIKEGEGAPMRSVLKDAKDLNMVIPPVVTNPSLANKTIHALGGGADVVNAAKDINNPAVVQAVRSELGFLPGEAMDLKSLNTKAVGTNLIWNKISSVSPEAAYAMGQFKDNSAKANRAYSAYNASLVKQPETLDVAKAFSSEASAAADLLQQELKSKNMGDLWNQFTDSRKLRAQIELTKEAISPGGRINADVFGNALENGRPLSGNLEKIARVQSEFSRYLAQFQQTPSGGASGIVRQVLGAVPKRAALSGLGQHFANPFYGTTNEDFQASLARYAAMNAGRQPNN